jgi:ketol-acid reductoisomerase
MAQIKFGDVVENVVTRDEWPLDKARETMADETIAVLGYGVQGPGQSLNLKDNGFNVIVGQRKGSKTWDKALADGWVEGENLFEIEEAARRGTVIQYLLSDAGQIAQWETVKKHLTPGKCLYFSHGFTITFKDDSGVIPPEDVDVVLVAPKGSGTSLRRLFVAGKGLNSSFAIFQDATGKAKDRVVSLGIGVGSGYLFETTFRKEVYSDLTGERGVLMGAIAGVFEAQYNVLRKNGHSPSEAFNETVEELTQSLMPLVAENGMDWMYANCSTTAQRGALDWRHKFREAVAPVYDELYESVKTGNEARIVIESCSKDDYRDRLEKELNEMGSEEIWRTGKQVRQLRPEATPMSTKETTSASAAPKVTVTQ